MLRAMCYRKFKVWQSYAGSKAEEVITSSPYDAARHFSDRHALADFEVFFRDQHTNGTKRYHNQEIGSIYVTEV